MYLVEGYVAIGDAGSLAARAVYRRIAHAAQARRARALARRETRLLQTWWVLGAQQEPIGARADGHGDPSGLQ